MNAPLIKIRVVDAEGVTLSGQHWPHGTVVEIAKGEQIRTWLRSGQVELVPTGGAADDNAQS